MRLDRVKRRIKSPDTPTENLSTLLIKLHKGLPVCLCAERQLIEIADENRMQLENGFRKGNT